MKSVTPHWASVIIWLDIYTVAYCFGGLHGLGTAAGLSLTITFLQAVLS